jgi:hypothetical protein
MLRKMVHKVPGIAWFVFCLATISGTRPYTVDISIISEFEAVGGMRIGMGNRSTRR